MSSPAYDRPPTDRALLADGPSRGDGPRVGDEVSLVGLLAMLLRYRRLLVALPLLLFAVVVGFGLSRARQFTSNASFVVQSSDANRSRLSGLAAQFGLNVAMEGSGQSPSFYVELLKSRAILDSVAALPVKVADGAGERTVPLATLYRITETDPARRQEALRQKLSEMIGVDKSKETGVVHVSATAPAPGVALELVQRLLERASDFNLRTRQSQAAAERKFVEARLQEVVADLRSAENRLEAFLRQNREFRSSPTLTFEHDRLSRAVNERQQVYSTLAQAYEQARIDEVRNTPVITVIEPPAIPARPVSRRIVRKGVLALGVGLLAALCIAFLREIASIRRARGGTDLEQLAALRREALEDLRQPWRPLSSAFRRRTG